MKKEVVLILLLLSTVQAAVQDEVLTELRVQHYEGYPDFTGYVERFSGDSTSETMGMMAMIECSYGSLEYCKDILSWMDDNMWSENPSYTFPWRFNSEGNPLGGMESATDGDLMLLWSLIKAHERSNDHYFLTLYAKWHQKILSLDTCTIGDHMFVASGTGIGRNDNCNSYNGVYAAYIMPSILFDLKDFDAKWEVVYKSSLQQTYDMYTQHGVFPPRCAGYDGSRIYPSKCELSPNYMDIHDAQRAMFWTGKLCKQTDHAICEHLSYIVNSTKGDISINGYNMDGSPRGKEGFYEFNAALWSPALTFADPNTAVIQQIKDKWNGQDFYGTMCDRQACVDTFKDATILLALLENHIGLTANPRYILLT